MGQSLNATTFGTRRLYWILTKISSKVGSPRAWEYDMSYSVRAPIAIGFEEMKEAKTILTRVGFEPTPFRTSVSK